METAKIIKIGWSKVIRVLKRIRLSGTENSISKEDDNVILSSVSKKSALETFFALPECPDFTVERDITQQIQNRDIF